MQTNPAVSSLSTSVMITRKDDVPLKVFYDYWADIHGVLAARAEGAFEYFQHRLGTPLPEFFQGLKGVDQHPAQGDPIVGLAEITFLTPEDRVRLVSSAAVGQMVVDEQNVLKGTYMYSTGPGNAQTLTDRTGVPTPQGDSGDYRLIVFVRQAQDVTADEFRGFLRSELAAVMAQSADVIKTRLHLLEKFEEQAWPTPNVDHRRSVEQQYDAYLELVFADEESAVRFSRSTEMLELGTHVHRYIAALVTYPDFETYTMVFAGRPTQVGLRGLSAFRTLAALNEPANQKSRDLLSVIFGDNVLEPLV